jgi:ATP-dependent RNA helicase HelY
VLDDLEYLSGDEVTTSGSALSRIYSELDLVAAECLRRSIWTELEPPQLAAVLSALVFESRNPDDAEPPRVPGGAVRTVLREMVSIWGDLDQLEREHRLSYLREPDLGFTWAAYRWAGGADLDDVLDDVDLAPGDFVRWVKQVLDLAEQVADAATAFVPSSGPAAEADDHAGSDDAASAAKLRRTARETIRAMRRGVVAYSADVDL